MAEAAVSQNQLSELNPVIQGGLSACARYDSQACIGHRARIKLGLWFPILDELMGHRSQRRLGSEPQREVANVDAVELIVLENLKNGALGAGRLIFSARRSMHGSVRKGTRATSDWPLPLSST